jgi:O-antigen ligase
MASHRTSERALWAAAMVALLACWPVSDVTFDGYHLPKELLLALAAAIVAPLSLSGRDAISRCVWGFAGLTLLSAAFAFNDWLSARAALLTLTGVALFEATRALDANARERVLGALGIAAMVLASIAFVESQGLLPGLSRAGRSPGATLGQRNAVAHVMVLTMPAMLHLARTRWPFRFGAALLTAVIILTRCRGAWLALAAVLVFWLARTGARRLVAFPLIGALLAALLPARLSWSTSAALRTTLARLFDASEGSGLGRLVQWRASLQLVPQHALFGVGPGNWMVAYPLVSPPGDPTFRADVIFSTGRLLTSDWVALPVERGLPALFVAAAHLVAIGVALYRSDDPLGRVSLATLVGLLVLGQFDSVLQVAAGLAAAALAIGAGLPRASVAPRGALALRAALAVGRAVRCSAPVRVRGAHSRRVQRARAGCGRGARRPGSAACACRGLRARGPLC